MNAAAITGGGKNHGSPQKTIDSTYEYAGDVGEYAGLVGLQADSVGRRRERHVGNKDNSKKRNTIFQKGVGVKTRR